MLVELDHFPKVRANIKKMFELPPPTLENQLLLISINLKPLKPATVCLKKIGHLAFQEVVFLGALERVSLHPQLTLFFSCSIFNS